MWQVSNRFQEASKQRKQQVTGPLAVVYKGMQIVVADLKLRSKVRISDDREHGFHGIMSSDFR
jgi:hypothetical protein